MSNFGLSFGVPARLGQISKLKDEPTQGTYYSKLSHKVVCSLKQNRSSRNDYHKTFFAIDLKSKISV